MTEKKMLMFNMVLISILITSMCLGVIQANEPNDEIIYYGDIYVKGDVLWENKIVKIVSGNLTICDNSSLEIKNCKIIMDIGSKDGPIDGYRIHINSTAKMKVENSTISVSESLYRSYYSIDIYGFMAVNFSYIKWMDKIVLPEDAYSPYLILENSNIIENRYCGIIQYRGVMNIENSYIFDNNLTNNIYSNIGIIIYGGISRMINSTISNNTRYGIFIKYNPSTLIKNCKINSNGMFGIYAVNGDGRVAIIDSECKGNGYGIWNYDKGRGIFFNNWNTNSIYDPTKIINVNCSNNGIGSEKYYSPSAGIFITNSGNISINNAHCYFNGNREDTKSGYGIFIRNGFNINVNKTILVWNGGSAFSTSSAGIMIANSYYINISEIKTHQNGVFDIYVQGGHYCSVENSTIMGNTRIDLIYGTSGTGFASGNGIVLGAHSSYCRIVNNIIKNGPWSNIYIVKGSNNNTIYNNIIFNSSVGIKIVSDVVDRVYSSDNKIIGNFIFKCKNRGIAVFKVNKYMYSGKIPIKNEKNYIINNVLKDIGDPQHEMEKWSKFRAAISLEACGDKSVIWGNKIFDCTNADGIALWPELHNDRVKWYDDVENVTISNNIIVNIQYFNRAAINLHHSKLGEVIYKVKNCLIKNNIVHPGNASGIKLSYAENISILNTFISNGNNAAIEINTSYNVSIKKLMVININNDAIRIIDSKVCGDNIKIFRCLKGLNIHTNIHHVNIKITDLFVFGSQYGIYIGVQNTKNIILIRNSNIVNNFYGIFIHLCSNIKYNSIIINYCNIFNNNIGTYVFYEGVYREFVKIDATRNYWGSRDGPSGEADGSGDPIYDNVPDYTLVDYIPYERHYIRT